MSIEQIDVQPLREQLQGSVFVPGDDGYERASRVWDSDAFEQVPAVVVMPETVADVCHAVRFARQHRLPIGVQGGGHGHPAPANGALLINFARMTEVKVNSEAAIASVSAGALAKDVVEAVTPYGLAPLGGFAPTVGVVGYMLGGGVGWLTRRYGPGAASIRAAEVVTADGHLLHVDENNHAELLWGLRGGGGNFGIVTSLEIALYPVRTVFGGQLAYPIELSREVLNAYLKWVKTTPTTLTSALRIMHFPDRPTLPPLLRGRSAIVVMACYSGSEADPETQREQGERLMQPLRALTVEGEIRTPFIDTLASLPFAQIASIAQDPVKAPPVLSASEACAFEDMTPDVVEALLRVAARPESQMMVELRHFGDALAAYPEQIMPFGMRRATLYMGFMVSAPSSSLLEEKKRNLEMLMQDLRPHTTGEAILNLAGTITPEKINGAYAPKDYQRLVALKKQYDPENVFRFNYNIQPAS